MSLRTKTLLVVVAALLGLFAGLWMATGRIVLGGFEREDDRHTRAAAARVRATIEHDLTVLDLTVGDWASWDDTYRFIDDADPRYVRSNLVEGTFRDLQLSVIAFVDARGRVVHGAGYDLAAERSIEVPAEIRAYLGEGSPLLGLGLGDGAQGVVDVDGVPVLLVSRPILTSLDEGPPRGVLVMGRPIDEALARVHRELSGVRHRLIPIHGLPGRFETVAAEVGREGSATRELDADSMAGYAILTDPAGEPSFLLEATRPRAALARGRMSQTTLIVAIALVAILLAALGTVALERLVLTRLRRMRADVRAVEETADPANRVRVSGGDELSDLGRWINRMLEAVERAHRDRRDAEERHRAVVEQASDGIVLFDPSTKAVIETNESYRRMTGFSQAELEAKTIYDLVDAPPSDVDRNLELVARRGRLLVGERRHRHRAGGSIDVEVATNLVSVGGRSVVSVVIRDLEPQRLAREVARRREAILEAVAFTAEHLFRRGTDGLADSLAELGKAAGASRVYVFENREEVREVYASQRCEWVGPGIEPQIENPELQDVPLREAGFERWESTFAAGSVIHGLVRDFPEAERAILEPQGIRSLAAVPIFAGDLWWGFMGFDDCAQEREWSSAEVGALRAAAGILGAALHRERIEESRAHAEAKFRTLVEQNPAAIFIDALDDSASTLYVSPQIETILGFAPEEWTGDPDLWVRRIHPDDRERVLAATARHNLTGEPFHEEYRLLHRDGHVVWVRDEARVERDRTGDGFSHGFLLDITPQKLVEEQLRERTEYLSALHETTLALMDRLDERDLLEAIAARAAELAGTEIGWVYLADPAQSALHLAIGLGAMAPHVGQEVTRGLGLAGRVWETGEVLTVENYRTYEHRLADFPDRFGPVVGVPLHSGGEVVGVLGLTREVSQPFTEAEIALVEGFAELASIALDNARLYRSATEEQERSRQLADAALEGICIEDDGGIIEVNRAFAEMFGYASDELAGMRLLDLFTVDPDADVAAALERSGAEQVELTALREDGGRMLVEIVMRSMAYRGRSVRVAAVRDVTERRRAEEAVRAAEEKYRGIFEHAAEGIFRSDRGGRLESVNPALARMLGYGSPEKLLDGLEELSATFVDHERASELHRLLEKQGEVRELEHEVRRRDGSTLWVSENARMVRDESGAVIGVEGTLLDISERRRAEIGLREAYEREVEAVDRLRALDEMKNAFMSAVSHELRTPLASILGFALTLDRRDIELPQEQVQEMVGRIAVNARKLERLLGDLLDLDRVARGILEPAIRPVDVGALARRVVEETDVGSRPVMVEAQPVVAEIDGPKVERILENLLANAAKYTPAGTPVWVRVEEEEGGVVLVVEDAGPGVPAELRRAIFEPFRQGQDAPQHAPGTGIGLSLVASFADLHGGRAWVTERAGGGASFRVFLPSTVLRALTADEDRDGLVIARAREGEGPDLERGHA